MRRCRRRLFPSAQAPQGGRRESVADAIQQRGEIVGMFFLDGEYFIEFIGTAACRLNPGMSTT